MWPFRPNREVERKILPKDTDYYDVENDCVKEPSPLTRYDVCQGCNKPMIYTSDRVEEVFNKTISACRKLMSVKGGEYSGDFDRLENFRVAGADMQVPMEQICTLYAHKHWSSIINYVKDLVHNKTRERSENIEGRIDDMINYLILLKCIIDERNNKHNHNEVKPNKELISAIALHDVSSSRPPYDGIPLSELSEEQKNKRKDYYIARAKSRQKNK